MAIDEPRAKAIEDRRLVSGCRVSVFVGSRLGFYVYGGSAFTRDVFNAFLVRDGYIITGFLDRFASSSEVVFFGIVGTLLR